MEVYSTARLRYVSIPPRKMRLVAGIIKGLPVEKALGILNFTPKIAAHHLAKMLKSAVANALSKEGTDNLRPEDLTVKSIIVDAAPTAKRIRFRSMGRVFRYRKRFCHVTVEIKGKMDVEEVRKVPKTKSVKKQVDKAEVPKDKAKKKATTSAKKSPASNAPAKRKVKIDKKNKS